MTDITKKQQFTSIAKGNSPADLVLANARVVNTFNGGIERANVAIFDGMKKRDMEKVRNITR